MEKNIAFAVHGGASSDDPEYILANEQPIRYALEEAAMIGYNILKSGGTAVDAVEACLIYMEDNELFNCGRGSSLNCAGKVDMDAQIADGNSMNAGAVTLLTGVKNPIKVARAVMEKTNCMLIGGEGALQFAKSMDIELIDQEYFLTLRQLETYQRESKNPEARLHQRTHGTAGAVALDSSGNLAAGSSTGGTCMKVEGRIGDTPVYGSGVYANNNTCAAAGTGDGEYLMKSILTYTLSTLLETTAYTIQSAADHVVHEKNKGVKGDIGVISLDTNGHFGIAYNSKTMPRAWISTVKQLQVEIV